MNRRPAATSDSLASTSAAAGPCRASRARSGAGCSLTSSGSRSAMCAKSTSLREAFTTSIRLPSSSAAAERVTIRSSMMPPSSFRSWV